MVFCYFEFLLMVLLLLKMPSVDLSEFSNSSFLGACSSQPCIHGLCRSTSSDGYRCYCKNGFTGLNCGTNYDDCRSNPCYNEASCVDGIASFKCICKEGFTGEQCETDIDECESAPCQNDGICEDLSNGYVCSCQPGFDGVNCEENVNACVHRQNEDLCENGGTCIVGPKDTYSCSCLPEFYGDNCELHACPCVRGICLKEVDTICLCPFGWTGKICESKVEFCEENRCQNEAVCVEEHFSEDNNNSSANYTCFCVPDYHGIHCEFRYDECIPDPLCNNGATCIDDIDSYSCLCPEGFTGVSCDELVDCADRNCTVTTLLGLGSHSLATVSQFLISSPSIDSAEVDLSFLYSRLTPSFVSTSSMFVENMSEGHGSIFLRTSSVAKVDYDICDSTGTPTESLRSCHSKNMHSQDESSQYDLPHTFLFESVIYESLLSGDELCKSVTYATDLYNFIFPVSTSCLRDLDSYILQSSFSEYLFTSATALKVENVSFTSSPVKETPFIVSSDHLDSKDLSELSQAYKDTSVSTRIFTDFSILPVLSTVLGYQTSITDGAASHAVHVSHRYESSSPFFSVTANVLYSSAFHLETVGASSSLSVVPNETDHSEEVIDSLSISATNNISTLPLLSSNNTTENSLPDVCFGFFCENGGTPSAKVDFQEQHSCECVCHLLYMGPRCEKEIYMLIPQFHGNSYLQHALPALVPQKGLTIDISFKTVSSEGIILFSEAIGASSFLMLYIDNGMLKFSFSCGHQTTVFMETHTAVNNSYFTSVSFEITWTPNVAMAANASCNVLLLINGSAPMSGQQFVVNPTFDFRHLFIGGIPMNMVSTISEVYKVQPLKGCVIGLQVNREEKELIYEAEDGAAITECYSSACYQSPCQNNATCRSYEDHWNCECNDGYSGPLCERKTCAANPCEHGSTCLPDTVAGYICICPYGKHGKDCEQDLTISHLSFFGDMMGYSSYIQYAENFNSHYYLEISLTFSISNILQRSLLLFSGQTETHRPRVDFFAVGIDSGYIVYLFNLGSGIRTLKSVSPLNSSIPIHSVLIGRHRRYGWLKVDGQRKVMGLASGHLTALNSESVLYIGGHFSYNFSLLPQEINDWKGFSGCVYDVLIRTSPGAIFSNISSIAGGRNVQQCNMSECQIINCANGGTCIDLGSTFRCKCAEGWAGTFCMDKETVCSTGNHKCDQSSLCIPLAQGYRCDCPLGRSGEFCEKSIVVSDPSFNGKSSFLSFEPMNIRHSMDAKISFMPMSENGLIYYSAQHLHELSQDFISVLIASGFLELRFNLGTGVGSTFILKTESKANLGMWNIVEFGRYKRAAYLKLNDEEITGVSTPGMEILDVTSDFFLGGLPDMSSVAKEAFDQDLNNFHGCIRLFEMNGKVLDINSEDVISGQNIEDCDGTSCGYATCKHGGTCVPNGENYECVCPDNYRGDTCEIALPCWNNDCQNEGICIPSGDSGYTCDCLVGWEGSRCQDELHIITAKFGEHSYLFYKEKSPDYSKSEISFRYSTERDNGLILWNGNIYSEDGDYLGIGLRNNHLHVVWNLGWLSRNEIMTDQLTHLKDTWHLVRIKQENQVLTLYVDEKVHVSHVSGDFYELNTPGDYFFGGFPRNYDFKEKTGGYFSASFGGCLKDIYVAGHQINIMNETVGHNIESCTKD